MELKDVGEIVASRKFELLSEHGSKEVLVKLRKPQPYPDSSGFFCPIQIVGVGDEKVRSAGGFDEMQSLQLALRMASVLIDTLDSETRSRLRWDGSHDLGFETS
jgi:hypothetical protein